MPAPSTKLVLYEKRNRVAYVTINRPEAMNSMNMEVTQGLRDAFGEIRDDPDVLLGIVTGAGGRAFSAGADIKEINERQARGLPQFESRPGEGGYLHQLEVWKPLIAAIDGYCVAGGFEIALECDIRIATEQSQFGLPEPRWSIMPGYGMHHLARMVPLGEAMYIMMTGSRISAAEAHRIGILHSVHPNRDALMAAAEKIADEIKLCAPLALKAIKQVAWNGRAMSPEQSYRLATKFTESVGRSEDSLEGPKAFTERRAPQWKGR